MYLKTPFRVCSFSKYQVYAADESIGGCSLYVPRYHWMGLSLFLTVHEGWGFGTNKLGLSKYNETVKETV